MTKQFKTAMFPAVQEKLGGNPMNLACLFKRHRRNAGRFWDGTLYHSHCQYCGTKLVRRSGEKWRTPDESELAGFSFARLTDSLPTPVSD
jgi:hypothetical protein